jgi:hypothetical protein
MPGPSLMAKRMTLKIKPVTVEEGSAEMEEV